ncbi:MAG: AAA family ATPase, partial [Lentisphaeria bacterium]|nr:AAA family ATPase [Lentisphaeria bacterium]
MRMAQAMAANLLHEYVLPEHLCLALLNDLEIADTVQECGGDVAELGEQLQEYLRDEVPARDGLGEEAEEDSPRPTLAYRRIINFAALHVLSCEKGTVDNFDTLIALYRERNSHAVYFLLNQGVTRAKIIEFASLDRAGHGVDEESDGDTAPDGDTARPARRPKRDPLAEFTTNLTAAATEGKIDPIIGRGKELRRVMRTLCRRRKNNPLLVGESGVGKTAIAEGLALRISEDAVPPSLQGAQVFALDLGGMLAGTKFRGEFEDRLKGVLKALNEHENAILFIDELHTAVGAGATQGGSMDAANLLKPALQSGDLRCMGSTTYKEYKSHILKDHALARRFQKIDVTEPSAEEAVAILKGLRTRYEEHFGIGIPDAALEAAVSLTSRYVNDRFLPDKAIDAMDEAGAEQALLEPEARRALTEEDIEVVVADMAQIPPAKVSGTDEERLRDLQGALEKVVYGQSGAVRSVTHAIKLSRAGLREPHKPVGSFLFAGPTGVGKTELAKQLANCLGIEFLRFDMSEYSEKHTVSRLIGAPPGYVGFDQGGLLTDAITKTPHAVLLLDEVEKAHADIFNILLQVMDHGTLTDNNGRKADFQNVI